MSGSRGPGALASLAAAEGAAPPGVLERFGRDPAGNALAVVVLAAMLAALAAAAASLAGRSVRLPRIPWGVIPLLALLGLGVAAYLAYVEGAQVRAVCGPVGDCNAVQQSSYARLFGVLPVGVLGMAGYLVIGSSWLVALRARPAVGRAAARVLWAGALLGVLFSLYLTFLEPFVIGATCAWCLSSAVLITLILVAATARLAADAAAGGAV